ncbi:helix-turn-helix transcriptional regulator [Bifidobacterium pseudolongum]|jgi:DNA-binding XRE family transcriptional regulator|uniref:helix-turn-helix transcriptional regulator n=1 Tax=Bifidobacterium pseudolongum TaxID=1694 RepID=UPI003516DBDC
MPTTIPYDILIEQDRRDPQAAAYMDEQGALMDAAVELMLAREAAHLSQEQLAEKSGVSRITISRIETGRISPSLKTLSRLAQAMGKRVALV